MPQRAVEKPRDEERRVQTSGLGSSGPTPWAPLRCFWYNQLGHRAVECLVPIPHGLLLTPGKAGPIPKKGPEKSWVVRQLEGVASQWTPLVEGEATAATRYQLVAYDNEDESTEHPMVSEPIHPFAIPIVLMSTQTGHWGGIQGPDRFWLYLLSD